MRKALTRDRFDEAVMLMDMGLSHRKTREFLGLAISAEALRVRVVKSRREARNETKREVRKDLADGLPVGNHLFDAIRK